MQRIELWIGFWSVIGTGVGLGLLHVSQHPALTVSACVYLCAGVCGLFSLRYGRWID